MNAVKVIAKKVFKIMLDHVMSLLSEEEIDELVKDWAIGFCEKHLTKEEIISEGKDGAKWFKEKFKKIF